MAPLNAGSATASCDTFFTCHQSPRNSYTWATRQKHIILTSVQCPLVQSPNWLSVSTQYFNGCHLRFPILGGGSLFVAKESEVRHQKQLLQNPSLQQFSIEETRWFTGLGVLYKRENVISFTSTAGSSDAKPWVVKFPVSRDVFRTDRVRD